MDQTLNRCLFATLALATFGMCSIASAQDNNTVWIEAENAASSNLKREAGGWGSTQFLSSGKWVNVSIDGDKLAQALPANGGLITYRFNLKSSGKHEIWNRVGFEFVRSPFEWHVDGGAWKKSSLDDLTTDLMPRAEWTEVAWLKLGERDTDEVRDNKKFEMARYIVHYADGQSVTIPVYSELDIENYRQENPRAIPGAQTAWVSKFPDSGESAVAYSKQWNNPRPEVTIKSIDFTYSADKRGVPVLLVITAATSGK